MTATTNTASGSSSSGPLPLLTWLGLQLAALLLAATNTPLWARPTHPVESSAIIIMLAIQAGAAVLLFPWLLQDWKALLLVGTSAVLFDQLSGMLAMSSAAEIATAASGIVLWLAGLALWNFVCTSQHSKLIAVSVLSAASIGLIIAIYASIEFGDGQFGLNSRLIWGVCWTNLVAAGIIWIWRRILAPSYPQARM